MGRSKPFIDKKKAVTFSLVYRSTEDPDALPEGTLVEADRVGLGRVDAGGSPDAPAASQHRYPPGHPLAWLEEEEAGREQLSEARRRELIELGFPDDGYDYIKHMRTLGRGVASLEGMPASSSSSAAPAVAADAEAQGTGPSVFVAAPDTAAPEEDVRVFDASALTVMQQAAEENEAAGMMGGVTAFSKAKERVHGAERRELAEIETLLAEVEEAESLGDAEGEGDLLDDFVLAATQVPQDDHAVERREAQAQIEAAYGSDGTESYCSSEFASEDEDGGGWGESGSRGSASEAGARAGRPPARPGSIASTYWREERHDRKNLLTVIDEKFEHLALEYDEDEIGDLDEQGPAIQGHANARDFDNLLDEFLDVYGRNANGYEDNVAYTVPKVSQVGKELEAHGFSDEDAAIAIQKAREALARAEAEDDDAAATRRDRVPMLVALGHRERERWDCESVLTTLSNLDNHPGRISEPVSVRRRSRPDASVGPGPVGPHGMIRLDPHGMPLGVLPPRHAGAVRGINANGAAAVQPTSSEDGMCDGAAREEEEEDGSFAAMALLERRKGESAEEKKARKAAVKATKRDARASKKELRQLFKAEGVKAQRRAATAQPQAAIKLPS